MLVVYSKKTDYDTKTSEVEKKLTEHDHNKYVANSEFNTLAANVFNARLAQANLMILMLNCRVLTGKLLQIKQSTYLLKANWKKWKHLIQTILLAKVILKNMVSKII